MSGARRALLIAVGTYDDPKLKDLRGPAADIERLERVLADPRIGQFEVDSLPDPDEGQMRRKIGRFFRDCERDDVLLMHVSCHGIKDEAGDLYFAASDTELDGPSFTGVAASWVNEQMTRSRSRRTLLMLDCCFSGKFPFGAQARSDQSVLVREHFEGRGRAVITASNAMEYAYEGDQRSGEGQPSIFTSTVIEVLQSGEADRDRDNWVSVDELYNFVYDRVKDQTPNQTPSKQSSLEGPLYIARSTYAPLFTAATLGEPPLRSEPARAAAVPETQSAPVAEAVWTDLLPDDWSKPPSRLLHRRRKRDSEHNDQQEAS